MRKMGSRKDKKGGGVGRRRSRSLEINKSFLMAEHYHSAGELRHAETEYQKALSQTPGNSDILYQLGGLYWQLGEYEKAATAYRAAIKSRPGFADAWCNLAASLISLSQASEAKQCLRKALKINPKQVGALYNLGGVLVAEGECKEAAQLFGRALLVEPMHVDAWIQKGNVHYEQGELNLAMESYLQARRLAPTGGNSIRVAAAIPMIPRSREHIQNIRDHFMKQVQRLINESISVGDPVKENGYTNFFLAYHGRDDLPLQKKYAELYEQACPSLLYKIPHRDQGTPAAGGKIRVGFISRYLMGHSIGKSSAGIIKFLDRKDFEVVVIFLTKPTDKTSLAIAASADEFIVLPKNLDRARNLIESKSLDILFYQDIGMDPFTYFLAFSRLAPIQCASFGHPVTTGIKNIDYYISTELWEPANAQCHYSETLIRLPAVASVAYYYKPLLPTKKQPRSDFGLPEHRHIYICPQTLFKFHPDFDEIIAGVLRKDEDGVIVLIEGKHDSWSDILRERFNSSIPDVATRIRFVARQSGEGYMNLLRVADVMLDTIHFCGFNTTLEGFVAGLPVVTLPGTYMRSRHTRAFYKAMDYMECVAESASEYVEIACRLGTDKEYASEVQCEIESRSHILWEDDRVVREFERFFRSTYMESN